MTESEKLKTEDRIVEVLKTVYDLKDDGTLDVEMTLTAPGCPMADYITEDVRQKLEGIDTIKQANINLVFDPVWDESMMSDEAKTELGMM